MPSRKTGLLLVAACWCAALTRAELRVVGSDLLGLEFTHAFYAHAGREGVSVALALEGTRAGFEQIRAGRADLGLLVLPPDSEGLPEGATAVIVGYHAVVVLVAAACPLDRITLPQLAAVFSGPTTSAVRWGDLGVVGEWSRLTVQSLAPDSSAGLTAEFFRSVVLRGGAWRNSVQRYANAPDLAARFGGEATPMALAASAPRNNSAIKVLPVAASAREPGVTATPQTLAGETYPLRVAVRAVFSREKQKAVAPLLRFLFSDAAAGALEAADIVPLPAATRNERLRGLAAPEKLSK